MVVTVRGTIHDSRPLRSHGTRDSDRGPGTGDRAVRRGRSSISYQGRIGTWTHIRRHSVRVRAHRLGHSTEAVGVASRPSSRVVVDGVPLPYKDKHIYRHAAVNQDLAHKSNDACFVSIKTRLVDRFNHHFEGVILATENHVLDLTGSIPYIGDIWFAFQRVCNSWGHYK